MIIPLVVALILGLSSLAQAATYFVATTGNNGNSCGNAQTASTPKQTINAGIGCLSAGDTLIVKAGTYNETILDTIPSGAPGNPTVVKSEVKGGAVLRPDGSQSRIDGVGFVLFGWATHSRSYVTFDGFVLDAMNFGPQVYVIYIKAPDPSYDVHHITISNNEIKNTQNIDSSTASDGFVPGWYAHDLLIQNNKIHDIGLGAVAGQAFYSYGAYWTCHDSIFEGNEIYNVNFGFGFHGYNSGGVSSNNIIRNNYIHDVGGTGMLIASGGQNNQIYNNVISHVGYQPGGNTGNGGIGVGGAGPNGNNNGVYNNTIVNAGGICLQFGGAWPSSNNTARNNICYQNGSDVVQVNSGSGNTIDHNLLGTNPLFVSLGGGNFHLQPGSPAIDVGITVAGVPTDLEGITRPQGGGYDYGAYEFAVISSPVTVYVATTGDDSRSCATAQTITTPKQTLASGITCLTIPGSTLYLRGGTYTSTGISTDTQPIVGGGGWTTATKIAAYAQEVVTLNFGAAYAAFFFTDPTNDHYIILDRLILDMQGGNHAISIYPGAHHIRLQNLDIKNVRVESVYVVSASNIEVLTSLIHDWTYTPGIAAIALVENSNTILVQGNEIYNGPGTAIIADGAVSPTGTVSAITVTGNKIHGVGGTESVAAIRMGGSGHANSSLINNLLYGNYAGLKITSGASDLKAYNNTIYGSTSAAVTVDSGATATEAKNLLMFGNGSALLDSGTSTATATNRTDNPFFVNPGAGDFTLQAGSPAINAGTTLAAVPTDILGNIRPQGAAYDVGAYEFAGASSVPSALQFVQQPVTTPRATTLPPITVQVVDQFGSPVTNVTASITVALGANPGGAALSGTTTIQALGGVATFSTLQLSAVGDGTTLTAASSGLTGATSSAFDILPNVPMTVYVSRSTNTPAGSDTRSCNVAQTQTTPLATLAKGLTCLVWPGSTLLLRGGTYPEGIDTGTQPITGGGDWSTPTTIAAYPTETVTLQAITGTPVVFLRNGATDHYLVLDRLILDGGGVTGTNGLAAYAGVHHIRFQRGEIKNSSAELVFVHQANSVEILTSALHNNTTLDAINVESTSDAILISGNDIFASPGRGIRIDADTGANFTAVISANKVHGTGTGSAVPAIVVGHGSNALVVNNLVYGNAQGIRVEASMDTAQVWHNTVYGNTGPGVQIVSGATNTQVKNTVVSGNGTAITNAGTGTTFATNLCDGAGTGCGIVGSPVFVNAGATDFHLQASSPARNAGSVLATVLTDFAGLPRPSGVGYDIGAYEYQESAAPRLAAIIAFQ